MSIYTLLWLVPEEVLVFLNALKIHFQGISPSALALYFLTLYSNVCWQNVYTNSLATFRIMEVSLPPPKFTHTSTQLPIY